jgi:hypothetical protein
MELSDQSAFLSEHTAFMTAEVFQTENIRAAMLAVPVYNRDRDAFCAFSRSQLPYEINVTRTGLFIPRCCLRPASLRGQTSFKT